jgi:hypothetical protein
VSAERLAERALDLVNIHSPSRGEAQIAGYVSEAIALPRIHASDDVLFVGRRRTGRRLAVVAGHLDTVPAQNNFPGRLANSPPAHVAASTPLVRRLQAAAQRDTHTAGTSASRLPALVRSYEALARFAGGSV